MLRCVQDGDTALMLATRFGHVEVVRVLMGWAEIDAQDAVGDPTMVTLCLFIYLYVYNIYDYQFVINIMHIYRHICLHILTTKSKEVLN